VSAGNRGSSRASVRTLEGVVSHVSMRVCVARLNAFKISRLLKIIGLLCKRALQKRRYSAKETYHFKEPTNRSHPIALLRAIGVGWKTGAVVMYVCV